MQHGIAGMHANFQAFNLKTSRGLYRELVLVYVRCTLDKFEFASVLILISIESNCNENIVQPFVNLKLNLQRIATIFRFVTVQTFISFGGQPGLFYPPILQLM